MCAKENNWATSGKHVSRKLVGQFRASDLLPSSAKYDASLIIHSNVKVEQKNSNSMSRSCMCNVS
jgi:hypothetical protein